MEKMEKKSRKLYLMLKFSIVIQVIVITIANMKVSITVMPI